MPTDISLVLNGTYLERSSWLPREIKEAFWSWRPFSAVGKSRIWAWRECLCTPLQTQPAGNTSCFSCACSPRGASECSSALCCAIDGGTTSRGSDFEPGSSFKELLLTGVCVSLFTWCFSLLLYNSFSYGVAIVLSIYQRFYSLSIILLHFWWEPKISLFAGYK